MKRGRAEGQVLIIGDVQRFKQRLHGARYVVIIGLFLLLAPMRRTHFSRGDNRQPACLTPPFLILEKDSPGLKQLNARVLTAEIKKCILEKRRDKARSERGFLLRERVGDRNGFGIRRLSEWWREGKGLLRIQEACVAGF